MRGYIIPVSLIAVILSFQGCIPEKPEGSKPIPRLEKRGNATQLIVDGKPFLVLGGELHNSSSSSRSYMARFWPELKKSNMNTVLAAVEWSLVEPVEGRFDFTVVGELIEDARANDLRLILLWFGSWKNAQLHYIPAWMKSDYKRFPRVKSDFGKSLEILSPFSRSNLEADKKAFTELMKYIAKVDSADRTVIMVQVENEVGVLGSARDHSEDAEQIFNSEVPGALMDHLKGNRQSLLPELSEVWEKKGFRETGRWEEVFGKGEKADEIFMAWGYSTYINEIIRAGKSEYNLPMFVNAWLVQETDRKPGDYPSGGPQAHMLDIWRAGAPDADLYCPDIYRPVFTELCELYTLNGNVLFIPESRAGEQGAGQLFYAIGRHNAIGYSPFGFESRTTDTENDPMTRAYKIAADLAPYILEAQEKGNITSVLLDDQGQRSDEVRLGNYRFIAELPPAYRTGQEMLHGYGIIIMEGEDQYLFYGKNIYFTAVPAAPGPAIAGIASSDEGVFENGGWIPGRRLNGDEIAIGYDLAGKARENKTATGIKFTGNNREIQRVRLYRYE